MIGLCIEFIAGRFHATPWDRAVNEGAVEWPPSPWRLLRAVTSGWYAGGANHPEMFATIVSALAEPPRFLLPPSSEAHTRHYMPQGGGSPRAPDTSLVLDAFRTFEKNAKLYVVWDQVAFSAEQIDLLRRACSFVSYLGRAESWCEIHVVDALGDAADDPDLIPVDLASKDTKSGPVVRRLGIDGNVRGAGLIRNLSIDTATMRKARRLLPLGSAWLEYRFPPHFGRDRRTALATLRARPFENVLLRFVLEGPGRDRQLRPSVSETVVIAETFRRTVMHLEGARSGGAVDPALSGKAADGRPASGHQHAFFLPLDLDNDGRIDHVDVWVPGLLGHAAYRALLSTTRLYFPSYLNRRLGLADGQEFTVVHLGDAPRLQSRRWRSSTPFILPRHQKLRGSKDDHRLMDHPVDQLRAAFTHHDLPGGQIVEWHGGRDARIEHDGGRATLAVAYESIRERDRSGRRSQAGGIDHAVPITAIIEFSEEQSGPIVLGKYAHFGMGQFVPDRSLGRAHAM